MADIPLRAVITADDRASGTIKGVSNSMSALNSAVLGYGKIAVAAFGAATAYAVKSAADVEMLRTNLDTLTGSAEKGSKMFSDLYKMAAKTPFETPELVDAAQMLLSYGVAQEKILPNLKMLGDVALGNREKFQRLALAYSQVQANGKLMGQDLLQMVNAGFNPLKIIADKTGKSMETLRKEMEQGKISADMVTDAFQTVTAEGGRFYQGTDKGAKTLKGSFSTLTDSVMTFARTMVGMNETGDVVAGGLLDKLKNAILQVDGSLVGLDQKVFGFINRVKEWINTNIWAQTFLIAFEDRLKGIWGQVQKLWEVIIQNKDAIQAWAGLIGGILVVAIYALTTALQGAIWYYTQWITVLGWVYDKGQVVANWFRNVFASVFDFVAMRWESGINRLLGFLRVLANIYNTISGGIAKAGINIGTIPSFQSGGIMKNDGLAYLHKGEKVTPAASVVNNDQGVTVQFYGNINNTANASIDAIGQRLGRQIQLAQQGI